ncbi:Mitogen-activated protein kinase kinase kinase mom-4 [Trichostrongylus colubriformis]|uniref:Mitogen-activated protein kinase kinase kinase mom-4 n=1 Tax=Trichostrongylus colubriformis TaxID=6319 RepID=A0AAN8FN20_TRICO
MSSSPSSNRSSTPRRNFLTKSRQDEDLCATIDVPIIDRSQIDDLNSTKLGEGTYGHVVKCRFRPTPDSLWENIAIKYGTDPSHAENLIREAKVILTHISHPNCIKIFGFYNCPKNGMGVAMELMDCNLAYLISKRTIEYKFDHAVSWLYQLSDAVNYFHSKNHVHRDLKLQNLLLCDRYHTLKVCDFGTFTTLHESMTLNRGTPMTMAPEIIRGSKNYTAKCDIYSFGIIMWQIIARRESPYLASHPHDAYVIYWNIVAKNLRPPKLSCHELLSRFYEKCWHDDPDQRPTSEQLMEYFSILKREYPNCDDPLIDKSTNEPAVTPQPKASTPVFQKHRRGRSDQSTLIKANGMNDVAVAPAFKKDEILNPNMRNCRSHSEITYRKDPSSEPLGALSRPVEMPANVLDYIDHSLRPADPIVGDEASEQIYNEHIAACHELYDYDLSLQRALADKHNAIVNLAHMEEYRKLAEKKRHLEQLRDDALKKIQQHS